MKTIFIILFLFSFVRVYTQESIARLIRPTPRSRSYISQDSPYDLVFYRNNSPDTIKNNYMAMSAFMASDSLSATMPGFKVSNYSCSGMCSTDWQMNIASNIIPQSLKDRVTGCGRGIRIPFNIYLTNSAGSTRKISKTIQFR